MSKQNEKKVNKQCVIPTELTEAEWAIMKAVWQNEPCPAGTVQEFLAEEKDWAYSTVKTTMDRMVEKGLLKIKKIRNLQLFSAAINETQARKGEFRKMLERAFDGARGPMMQFVVEHEKLSKHDLQQLRQLIGSANKSSEKR
jgi:predicted transcriptional regulator